MVISYNSNRKTVIFRIFHLKNLKLNIEYNRKKLIKRRTKEYPLHLEILEKKKSIVWATCITRSEC